MQTLSVWPDTPEKLEKARDRFDRYTNLSRRYRDDASLRARIEDGDTADSLETLGIDVPDGVEARIVVNTAEVMHVVLPPDPNLELAEEALDVSAGGKTAGTGGTAATMFSFGCSCGPSCASSAGTIGTAGSAGGD